MKKVINIALALILMVSTIGGTRMVLCKGKIFCPLQQEKTCCAVPVSGEEKDCCTTSYEYTNLDTDLSVSLISVKVPAVSFELFPLNFDFNPFVINNTLSDWTYIPPPRIADIILQVGCLRI